MKRFYGTVLKGRIDAKSEKLGFGNLRLSAGLGNGLSMGKEFYRWVAACSTLLSGEKESELDEVGVTRPS